MVGDSAAAGTATGGGHDTFQGDEGNDLLVGDNQKVGHAKLKGGGPDLLRGGDNNDRFNAGPARDTCQGGTGHDRDLSHPRCEKRSSIP
jgi:Ca2+-binding RTX toxin-like protein